MLLVAGSPPFEHPLTARTKTDFRGSEPTKPAQPSSNTFGWYNTASYRSAHRNSGAVGLAVLK
jgi:hypothetical protein